MIFAQSYMPRVHSIIGMKRVLKYFCLCSFMGEFAFYNTTTLKMITRVFSDDISLEN